MRHYGLIGGSLSHSWSARHFVEKFAREGLLDCRYDLYPSGEMVATPDALRAWLARLVGERRLMGFNVTIPFKEWVLPCLDELDDVARAVGAVNCVRVRWDGERPVLRGFNTDAPAFLASLRPLLMPWHGQALVLGTGGAAKAVAHALRQAGIGSTLVSRRPKGEEIGYDEAARRARHIFLLVNCTPVGTAPRCGDTPWHAMGALTPRHLCYDLVYNPPRTRFLAEAARCGAATKGGLEMLRRQADLSWEIWQQPPAPVGGTAPRTTPV